MWKPWPKSWRLAFKAHKILIQLLRPRPGRPFATDITLVWRPESDRLNRMHYELMRVSIALCTSNGQTYLQEQLESYLNQTRTPDELVVCDDVSSDETITILQEFARSAPFT